MLVAGLGQDATELLDEGFNQLLTQPRVHTGILVDAGPIIPERDFDAIRCLGKTQPEFAGVASIVGVLQAFRVCSLPV